MRDRRILLLIPLLVVLLISPCLAGGKWYNYYEEGMNYMKRGEWEKAIEEFKSAVSLEFKEQKNFRMYGMHFIDYFPHREMAICYYHLRDYENAKKELQLSLAFARSGRAQEFLDKLSGTAAPPPTVKPTIDRAEEERLAAERKRIEEEKLRIEREKMELAKIKEAQLKEEQERKLAEEAARVKKAEEQHSLELAKLAEEDKLPTGTLTYDPSKVTQIGSRLSIAVMPFENKGGSKDMGEVVLDKLITSLYKLKRFKIIERTQLEKVLKEQALGQTGAIDAATATKVGKVLGVDAVLIGSITQAVGSVGIDARLIDTQSGTIITAEDAYLKVREDPYKESKALATSIAIQIYNDLPLVEGQVIQIEPTAPTKPGLPGGKGKLYVDIGSLKGMRKGMKCVVFKKGDAIVHPVTGEILGSKNEMLGEVLLEEVQDKMSIAMVVDKEAGKTIVVGDRVVAK